MAAAKLVFSLRRRQARPRRPTPTRWTPTSWRCGAATPPRRRTCKALFEACPASLLFAIAAVAAPQVQEHLEAAFAQGVRRQGESEERDKKFAPEVPGPYPGRKADWAPPW